MTHDELMKRLTQMSGDTPMKRMNFYMKYIQPIKEYFKENAPEPELDGWVNEPEITDEEIEKWARAEGKLCADERIEQALVQGRINGAKWMRNKLKE